VTACEVADAMNARIPRFPWKSEGVSAALAIRQENLSCGAIPISGNRRQGAPMGQRKTW